MSQPYLTAPQKISTMPPGIPYIVGNEAAERFNFYGMRAVLVIFMTQFLVNREGQLAPMTESEANKWYHLFLATNYFLPVFGAILADAFLGKYKTIIWLSLVYCLGSIVLAIDHTRTELGVGLMLIAIGSGGIKPCVSAHVGDQFSAENERLLSKAFGWFYFSINAGSLISIPLTPILLHYYGPRWAFGVPAALMLLATFVFWLGRYKFAHIPPAGRAFFRDNFNAEGRAAIGRIALIYVFVAVFWSLWDQSGGEWVLQAEKMDRQVTIFGWSFEVFSSQVQTLNAVFILVLIPVCSYVLYPAIDRVFPLNPLRKIGLGLLVTVSSFLISAWIESRITAGLRPSIAWQVPAYLLLSLGEVMVSVTALEFAYTQAPKRMKSIIMSLYLLAISAGNLFTALVHHFIANEDGTTKLPGATFYLFFAGLCLLTAGVFAIVARSYQEKSYLQDEATTETAS
ncbi:MAG TPA: POT family MFS transporter [Opitutus sp.]|nr:POT family MFS transporter [Opitutus sp.]